MCAKDGGIKKKKKKEKDGLVSPICQSSLAIKQIESNGFIRNIYSLHDQKNTGENMKKGFLLLGRFLEKM